MNSGAGAAAFSEISSARVLSGPNAGAVGDTYSVDDIRFGNPVKREAEAIHDLGRVGIEVDFVPYDK